MKKTITTLLLAFMCALIINAQDYTVTPENGSVVEALTDITITWSDESTVEVDATMMVGGAKVYIVNGTEKTFCSDIFCGPAWGSAVTLSLMNATSDANDYLVEIPEGMFIVNDAAVPAFTLNYSIGGIPVSTAKFDLQLDNQSLMNIKLSVEPCAELTLNPEATDSIQIIHNNGFAAYYAATYTPEITGNNTATLSTTKNLANGSYSLVIPKGIFLIDGKVNPAIIKEFDLSVKTTADNYIIEPANSSVLETIADIYITWEDATEITVDPNKMIGGIIAYKIGVESKTYASDVFCGPAFGNYVMLSMTSPISDAGEYVIEIPDNMFTVDGVAIKAFDINYSIPGTPVSNANFDIVASENNIGNISITITPCEELTLNEETGVEAPFIIHNDGFNAYVAATYTVTVTGANTATLTTDANFRPGNYTLHIPKGVFLINGELNPLILANFDIAAVNSIIVDDKPLNVYNLNGVRIITDGNKADIEQLQDGIYIINGEKKFIRNNK